MGDVNGLSSFELKTEFLFVVRREIRECRVKHGKGFVKFCSPEAAEDALKIAGISSDGMKVQTLFPN